MREDRLPAATLAKYPDLAQRLTARGLPSELAAGRRNQQCPAITLWRTIFVAPRTPLTPGLLLHELRHVHQFLQRRTFPFSYLWQSIRYGYSRNAYEEDARRYAASRLAELNADKEL